MHISNKRNTISAKYTINGFPLNCVSGVKYLGVSISSKMSWSDHIDDICTKARKSLRFIRRNLRNFPQYVRNQAYTSLVRSMLLLLLLLLARLINRQDVVSRGFGRRIP